MSDPIFELPFFGGIDESTRDELVEPGAAFAVLENVRYRYRGGLAKRLGYTSLALTRLDATSRSAGNRCFPHRDQVCVLDGSTIDVYSPTTAVSVSRGRYPEASFTQRPTSTYVSASDTSTTDSGSVDGVAYANGYVAILHDLREYTGTASATSSVVVAIEEASTGEVMRAPEVLFTSAVSSIHTAAIASYSTYLVCIYTDIATGTIAAKYLNTASASTINTGWVAIGSVATDKTTTGIGCASLEAQSLSNRVALAYINDSAGTSQVTVKTITIAGVTETATVNTSSVKPVMVALEGSISDTLWVAWNETTSVKLKGLDADVLATTLATTTALLTLSAGLGGVIGIVSGATAGEGRIIARDGFNKSHVRGFQTTGGAVAADGSQVDVPNAFHSSQPFRVGTRYYATFFTNELEEMVLCDFTEDQAWVRPIANIEPALVVVAAVGRPQALSSTSVMLPVDVRRSAVARATLLVTFDFADPELARTVSFGGATYLTGGLLSYFDGRRVAEADFVVRPPAPTCALGSVTGLGGTYRYVLVYEEVDANGVWWQSSVSDPSDEIEPVGQKVLVTFRPLAITARQVTATGPIRCVLYRTTDGGEAPYYRLADLTNDTASATTTYTDSLSSDTALSTRPTLYLQPGVPGTALDRRAPPGVQCIVQHGGMLVGASGGDLWNSGQHVLGEGPWFSPIWQTPVAADAQPITALAVLDGTIYAFRRDDIYALAGEAPSDNATVGGLGAPRLLSSDVGCISASSVVATGGGIFFQSARGIELLTRAGAVSWIGEQVLQTMATYPVVSSATLDDRNDLVRFTLATAESGGRVSGDGRDLVYDLSLNAWISVDDKRGGSAHQASQDAAMLRIGGTWRYSWLATDGTLYYERSVGGGSDFLDASTWVTQKAVTSWIHLAGLQGEQFVDQVLALAKHVTGHELTISLAFDYVESFTESKQFTAAQVAALSREWLVWGPNRTKHSAIKVKLEDATPSTGSVGTGEGATWVCLTLNGQPHRGPRRSHAAARGA